MYICILGLKWNNIWQKLESPATAFNLIATSREGSQILL